MFTVQEFIRFLCIVNEDEDLDPENASAAGTAEQTDTDAGVADVADVADAENEDLIQEKEEKEEIRDTKKKLTALDFKV
jgi:hypothetical protein